MRNINVSLVALLAALMAASTPARAQVNDAPRPYKALFGGSAADPDVRHSFDVSASVLGGYDDNALGSQSGGAPQSLLYQTGFFTGLSGRLSYFWQGKNLQIGARAGTDARYYAEQGEFLGVDHFGGIGFSAQLGARTRIDANQSISYSPAYLYALFPSSGPQAPGQVVGVGDPLGEDHVFIYDTSATFTRDVSRRGSIEALGNFRYSDYNQADTIGRDLRSYFVGGRYRQSMTRYAGLRLGYVYRKGNYGFLANVSRPTTVHDLDIGVDYRRPLSLTRRTTVNFGVGSSIVNTPIETSSSLQYRVVGDVGLTHQMGRTWSTDIKYSRGVGFTEGFAQPIFSDGVSGTVSGFFSRRIDFNASGGLSIGDAGINTPSTGQGFKAYTASARARYALGSMWALFGTYSFYSHDLGNVLIVAEGVPPNLKRNSAQVGVTLWFPLLSR